MARYRLLARAVFDGALREPGEEVEWDGEPGPHMVPILEPPPPLPRPPAASPPRSER